VSAQGRKHLSLYSSEFYFVLIVISATLYLGEVKLEKAYPRIIVVQL